MNTKSEGRQTCNVLQAQTLAHVSRRTIYNWLRDNKVEFVKMDRGSVRIYVDSLPSSSLYRRRADPQPHISR
jgi:excisionase family DNA binding protein